MASPKATVDELAPFILRDIEGLESGEKKGAGAYGAVYEVAVKAVPYIAKRLHDILVNQEVSPEERTAIQQKFRQECVTLSKLKHPNIVHFVGVHYGRAPGDVSLIMEKLHTDLGKFLDTRPNSPLPLKLSILLDISYGLLYLHTLSPKPIIHRDLTASNIFLTSDMRAKIGDLGVSKMLDLCAQVARTQTKAPGSLYYMPPEALSVSTQYGVELDVFSFGHLALYTITQAPPEPDDTKVTPTAVERGEMQLAKREANIDIMGRDHCLCPLIMQCLQDRPEQRPTTSDLNQAVKELSVRDPVDLTHEMDENRKLLDDLQEANKDRGYLKEALAAAATSREELITRVQLLEAQIDDLRTKEEPARQQLKSLRDNYRTMQQQYREMKAESEGLFKQMEKLHTLGDDNMHLQIKIRDLHYQLSSLRTFKADLLNDLEAARAEALIYKENFEKERQDRAKMDEQYEHHAKELKEKTSLIDRVQIENQKLIEQLKKLRVRVDEQKDELQVAKAETMLYKDDFEHEREERIISFGKIDEKQQQLKEVELMAQTKETAARRIGQKLDVAQEEVRAKTSQVKQYKKQVDQLKAQVTELEGHNMRLIGTMEDVRKELEKTRGSTKFAQKLAKENLRKKKPDRSLASPEQPMSLPLHKESTLAKAETQYEKERDKNDDAGRRSATASPLNSPMEDHPQPVQGQSMPQMVGHLGAEHHALHVHATSDPYSTEV